MVKQPNESIYVKSSNRINAMRQVYEMRYMQNLSVPEIISKTGIKQTQIYRFLHTFASEYPDLVGQMKKKVKV
jgi:predicted DNA-binding transcriptional regulator AlpA